jgi:hypothetical protein
MLATRSVGSSRAGARLAGVLALKALFWLSLGGLLWTRYYALVTWATVVSAGSV